MDDENEPASAAFCAGLDPATARTRPEAAAPAMKLFRELRRRRVWRVAGAYAFAAWMVVEVILETAPVMGLPEWISPVAIVLAVIGFPVAVFLAWAFDLTPEGVVRTPSLEAPAEDGDAVEAPGSTAAADRRIVLHGPGKLAGVFGAGIVVALVGFGAYSAYGPRGPVAASEIRSLAVLPFNDLSPAGDQGYFVAGVAEELLNQLARLEDIRVAGRTSSFTAAASGLSLREIGERLGVDAVVEGSVRRDGDRLRITAELVDAATGFQVWAGQYDRTVDDIFAIQDEIAQAVVDTLRVQLVPGASRYRAGTEDIRAHDAYLLGLSRWHARTEADLIRALEYFEEAIRHDDSYAPAHAGLALTYAILPIYSDIPLELAAELGSEAAARALALDGQLAEAHAAIGQISQVMEWNVEAAEMAYRRAIEFQPNNATAHQWRAESLIVMGRLSEAEAEISEALRLDPLSVAAQYVLGYLHLVRHRYDEAESVFRSLLEENPETDPIRAQLYLLCLAAECDADPPAPVRTTTAIDALVLAARGKRERALDALVSAYGEPDDGLLPLWMVHPLFDPLRNEPRFREIADGLGAEAPAARLSER